MEQILLENKDSLRVRGSVSQMANLLTNLYSRHSISILHLMKEQVYLHRSKDSHRNYSSHHIPLAKLLNPFQSINILFEVRFPNSTGILKMWTY